MAFAARWHPPRSRRGPRRNSASLLLTASAIIVLLLAAGTFVAFVLWPTRFSVLADADAPTISVTVAGVAFNIPTPAIRVPLQKRSGAQERLDLAFMWPSLTPPDPAARPDPAVEAKLDRLFLTITTHTGTLAMPERVKTIYPRYLQGDAAPGPAGLMARRFTDGSPYRNEDLIYDPTAPDAFIVRCTRPGAGTTPGMCILERRIASAEITARFPRDWLSDWRDVGNGVDQLIASLRPRN